MSEQNWTKQIRICLAEPSSTEVTGPSEVLQFVR